MAYATISDLKSYIGLSSSADDALLTKLVDSAKRVIDAHCRRTFEATADTTRYFNAVSDLDYSNRRRLLLDEDLCAITSITNGDGTIVAPSDYITVQPNRTPWYGIELKSSSLITWTYSTTPENAISIVGKWAYSVTVPADIHYATIRLASWMYRQRDSQADLDRPVSSPSGTMLMPIRLPSDVLHLVRYYERTPV